MTVNNELESEFVDSIELETNVGLRQAGGRRLSWVSLVQRFMNVIFVILK